jgi:hypothetical protein
MLDAAACGILDAGGREKELFCFVLNRKAKSPRLEG